MAKYAVRIDGLLHSKTAQGGCIEYSKIAVQNVSIKNTHTHKGSAAQPFFIIKQQ